MDENKDWAEQRKHAIVSGIIGFISLTICNMLIHRFTSESLIKFIGPKTEVDTILRQAFTAYWIVAFIGITLGIHYISTETRKSTEKLIIQKKNQQFQQQMKMQNRMVNGLVHDLRTPVTSVMGYMELIKSGAVEYQSEQYWDFIETVENCARRLENMTDEMLESVKLMSGKAQLNLESVDIDNLLDEISSEIKPILMNKNQSMNIVNEKGIQIRLDKMKIHQATLNILTNASKFSPDDSVIEMEVKKQDTFLEFIVSDKGIGLRQEDLPKLFTTFPDIEVDGEYDRIGLGLSTVKSAVELHGGHVYANSKGEGKGTSIGFQIPMR